MLVELTIRNIALIESLRISFAQGFNVLTGETGSGKSIVVDSLNLALGGRADRELIRNGSDKARVEAVFDISESDAARRFADENGIEVEDGLVGVSRELTRSGRNVCRISGSVLPLSVLREFTGLLIDVHGQHEHQALMDPQKHIGFLDAFGDREHAALIDEVRELSSQRTALAGEIRRLLRDTAERARLGDMLGFQVQEIETAKLKAGEEEKLEAKLRILENSEKVRQAVDAAYALTYDGGSGNMSAQEALLRACNQMQGIAGLDAKYGKIAESLRAAYDTVKDLGGELMAMRDAVDDDPALMNRIAARLDLIDKLERKYGATEEDVIRFGREAKARLEELQSGDDRIADMKKEYKKLDSRLREKCEALTASRHRLADALEHEILEQLADLGMGRSRFEVRFTPLEKPAPHGMEDIEFMISTNPGEPIKPLASVASGGELSRIMLAFKVLSMNHDDIGSMVFDEIDTGVSGRMAQVVGEKMLSIGIRKQVLCVTHLPQIAVLAHNQLRVEKNVDGEHTNTDVITLDEEGRVHEIARLVGSATETESSLAHARSMLEEASETRTSFERKYNSHTDA